MNQSDSRVKTIPSFPKLSFLSQLKECVLALLHTSLREGFLGRVSFSLSSFTRGG